MNLKSNILKNRIETTPHRSLLRAAGVKDSDFNEGKPFVGVANAYNNIVPGHTHLNALTQEVMRGIRDAGGVPFTWGVPAVCDGIAMYAEMRLSLPSRDHIADNIEIMMLSHSFDGWVGVTNCDKITPGMLMAAGRLNLPAVILTGGPMKSIKNSLGENEDPINGFAKVGAFKAGNISKDELKKFECKFCPSAGSCTGLFTANSMACMTEVLGMSLTDCACTLAVNPDKLKQAYESGKKIVELIKKDIKARDIMTKEAFFDCMTVDNAIGGSTNVTLHIPAIANECGIKIGLKDFDKISKITPNICHINPSGPYVMEDVYNAGGIKSVMFRLKGKLNLNRKSINGNLLDIIKNNEKEIQEKLNKNTDVIRPIERPYYKEGGVACLTGNIAEESVVKQTSVEKEMLVHSGPAKIFNSEQDLLDAISGKKIKEGDVIILPFMGPAGAPGMPEMLTPTAAIKGAGFKRVALITDGRFSGGTAGPCIGHIYPEAINGGKIGLLKNGDIIEIDMPKRKLNAKVSESEFKIRAKKLKIPKRSMTPLLVKFREAYLIK